MSQIVAIQTEAVSQIVAIQAEDRILLVQQSAIQGPPGPAGASGSGVAVSGGTGTVTSVGLIVPSGLVASGGPVTSSGAFTVTYASGIRAYTTAEATKLAGVASGATANSGTVTSIALTMPSGLVVSGSPVVSSGLLTITYASGVQAYTSAEAVKLTGIASGATVSSGTVTSISLVPPSGLVVSGSPIVGSGTITLVYASGIQAYTIAESNKLTTIASGAQVNVGTNLSYSGASRALDSSTGSGVILPLFSSSEAGLVGSSGGGSVNFLRADGQWAAPPVGSGNTSGQQYAAGYWLAPVQGIVTTGATMVANTIYFYPVVLARSITVSELGARVNTVVAGSSIQLAFYGSLNGEPDDAPLGVTTSLSSATSAPVSENITDFNLSGLATYWMAVNSDGAPALQHVAVAATNTAAALLGAPTLTQVSAGNVLSGGWRSMAQTFGSWPTLASGMTTVQTGAPRGGVVYLRVAALI
jgi:hypothetical protein